jgi:YVTN family beta-propeller protein
MKLTAIYSLILCTVILMSSCKKEDKNENLTYSTQGVYVVNEGAFGSGNSSVSFLDLASGQMLNNLFENTNGIPLGDVAQSMTIYNNSGYVIVNNSAKIEVVNLNDFSTITTINGLQGPRYMVVGNGKGYASDWFSNEVVVIDLATNTITNHIPTGAGPEQMLISNNRLFVANIGGYGNDSTVTVINTDLETVEATIQVGLNPNSIARDADGQLWILCGGSTGPDFTGGTADDIAGSLHKLNPSTLSVDKVISMNSNQHPVKLQVNTAGTTLYFLDGDNGYTGKISKLAVTASSITEKEIIVNRDFYGLALDEGNNLIYAGFAPSFSQNGYVFRYTVSGSLVDYLQVGIAPNYFSFR